MSRSSSILGIDFAYAIAIVGTVVVSMSMIVGEMTEMLTHVDYFLILDFFPALFFFLNGTTVALSMRDKRVSRRRLLSYLGKRGSVLMIAGLIFLRIWPMNVFFMVGILFMIAPMLVEWSNLVLRMLIVLIALCGVLLINTDVHTFPLYSSLQLQDSGLKELFAWLLFNGYYAFIPFSVFFIAGIMYGRGEMRMRGILPPGSIVSILMMAAGFVVQRYAMQIANPEEMNVAPQPFPLNVKLMLPAFIIFTLGALHLFMNTSIYIFRKGMPDPYKSIVQLIAGAKYSIYLFQLIIGFIVLSIFNLIIFQDRAVLGVFNAVVIIFCVWFVRLWKSKLDETPPMERIIKRISGSAKKS